jgi:hypothetical protein
METQGKKGLFSVTVDYQVENNYQNSLEYTNYLKSLAENQRFILNKIFNVKQRLIKAGTDIMNPNKITREMYMSYACFNNSVYGQGEGNLEQYLKLITSMSLPLAAEKSSFFIESKDRILSDRTMSEVLEAEQFSFSKSESTHKHLWRTLVNTNPDEFSAEKSKEVISYALNNLPQYSLLEIAGIGVGLRKYLTFYIVKLLDQVGWRDNEGKHRKDTDENICEIAQWIFGEGDHKEEGALDILGKEERGIMGLYDLLLFRLSCCADRSRNIPYLTRSLFKHGNRSVSKPVNAGIVLADEMRLISQKVFRIFQSQFINQNKNIFDEIDNLTLKDICGEYYDFIAKFGNVDDIEVQLSSLKSIMKSFIVDQLGNTLTGNRIGCGYYNANGDKDENSINQTFNEYLFEYCFNPQKQGKNYKHFMDCLLYNFSLSSGTNEKYMYNIKDFIKVLDKDRLTAYWNKNVKFIKNKRYESEDRKIFLGRDVLSYSENLPKVYRVLDEIQIKDKLD